LCPVSFIATERGTLARFGHERLEPMRRVIEHDPELGTKVTQIEFWITDGV
jgi:hypothetical protein